MKLEQQAEARTHDLFVARYMIQAEVLPDTQTLQ